MTNLEIGKFCERLYAQFSQLQDWSVGKGKATFQLWIGSWKKLEFSDAMQVLEEWLDGTYPPPQGYESDQLGPLVCQRVREIASQRATQAENRRLQSFKREYRPIGLMGVAFLEARKINDRVRAGELSAIEGEVAVRAVIEREFPPADGSGPRVNCRMCQDRGTIQIWHPKAVAECMRDQSKVSEVSSTCVCACSCSAGEHFRQPARGRALPTFDESVAVRASCNSPTPQDRRNLALFVEEKLTKPKFAEFADWN